MTSAQFYFTLSVPLIGILADVVLITMLNLRLGRLEDRVHTGRDLLDRQDR